MSRIYLVTGGAGHLGGAVVQKLCRRGEQVRVLCLPGEANIPKNTEVFYGNICQRESLNDFFTVPQGCERIVIHCAGIVSISSKYRQDVYDVNVGGTKNVTDECLERGCEKLVYVSSVHAFPEQPEGVVVSESKNFNPSEVNGLYAKTKSKATAYVLAAAKRGLNACVVHPSGIIGPGGGRGDHLTALIRDYVTKKLTAAVHGGYDFVDVRDVADGIISCCDSGDSGENYILSNNYFTIKSILCRLHEITGVREIKTYLPVGFVKAVAPLCEIYYKLRKQPPLFTRYSIEVLSGGARFTHAKATAAFGYTTRDIDQTLFDTVSEIKR